MTAGHVALLVLCSMLVLGLAVPLVLDGIELRQLRAARRRTTRPDPIQDLCTWKRQRRREDDEQWRAAWQRAEADLSAEVDGRAALDVPSGLH